MWSVGVVLDLEVLGQHLSFEEGLERLDVEKLVSELAVDNSMNEFTHGFPGSMLTLLDSASRHQPGSALAVSSGPLSLRMNSGARQLAAGTQSASCAS